MTQTVEEFRNELKRVIHNFFVSNADYNKSILDCNLPNIDYSISFNYINEETKINGTIKPPIEHIREYQEDNIISKILGWKLADKF